MPRPPFVLTNQPSVGDEILAQLRDSSIQRNRYLFRKNIEKIGMILAYEISKSLSFNERQVETPLGISRVNGLTSPPVIATILRAGIPLQNGLAHFFTDADLAYVSAYRKYTSTNEFDIVIQYVASPDLNNRTLIVADPMIATGRSVVDTIHQLKETGIPLEIHIAAVIGSIQGVDFVKEHLPEANIWIGTIDEKLNDHGYIVPGLGDAGDLSFGEKLDR